MVSKKSLLLTTAAILVLLGRASGSTLPGGHTFAAAGDGVGGKDVLIADGQETEALLSEDDPFSPHGQDMSLNATGQARAQEDQALLHRYEPLHIPGLSAELHYKVMGHLSADDLLRVSATSRANFRSLQPARLYLLDEHDRRSELEMIFGSGHPYEQDISVQQSRTGTIFTPCLLYWKTWSTSAGLPMTLSSRHWILLVMKPT